MACHLHELAGRPKGDSKLNQQKILVVLMEEGPLSASSLEKKVGIGRTTRHRLTEELVSAGVITKLRSGRKTIYEFNPNPNGYPTLEAIWYYSLQQSRKRADKAVLEFSKRILEKKKELVVIIRLLRELKKQLKNNANEIYTLERSGAGYSPMWGEELRKVRNLVRARAGARPDYWPDKPIQGLSNVEKQKYIKSKIEPYKLQIEKIIEGSDMSKSDKETLLQRARAQTGAHDKIYQGPRQTHRQQTHPLQLQRQLQNNPHQNSHQRRPKKTSYLFTYIMNRARVCFMGAITLFLHCARDLPQFLLIKASSDK